MAGIFSERLIVDDEAKKNIIYDEHLIRYKLASKLVKNNKVLDIACGSGYGAKILAEAGAIEVTAIDLDEKAIESAKKNYYHENIKYIVGRAEKIEMKEDSFDVITSFETIEHLQKDNHNKFFSELTRVLKHDGVLIISTPNKKEFKEENPYHFKEYEKEEFENIIKKYFKHYQILEQKNGVASCLETKNETGKIIMSNTSEPQYFVAVCSNEKLGEKFLEETIVSINSAALKQIYNNPGLKIVNKIYSFLIKIPGVKKLFSS